MFESFAGLRLSLLDLPLITLDLSKPLVEGILAFVGPLLALLEVV